MDAQKTHFADDDTLKHIERLESINAELVAALERIAGLAEECKHDDRVDMIVGFRDIRNDARVALAKSKES